MRARKLNENFGNKEREVQRFYDKYHKILFKETYKKFKEVFEEYLNINWDGSDRLDLEEEIQNIYWKEIVEPGWAPDILVKFDSEAQSWGEYENGTEEDVEAINAYNLIWDKFYEIEKDVCEELGIPPEAVDL
jgi:predicted transposase